ncbi:MAG: hypothetical protein K0Q58_730 [Microbacterium sp.]|nr:hypothetical protein [Microbacterium sp.]
MRGPSAVALARRSHTLGTSDPERGPDGPVCGDSVVQRQPKE